MASTPKPDDKSISLTINSNVGNTVTVELYQEGKMIRMREIGNFGSFIWPKLKPGRYEVHFLTASNKPFIKRLLISEDDPSQVLAVELSPAGGVVGGGVSLQELAEAIEKLKKENAELRAEIEKLKKK